MVFVVVWLVGFVCFVCLFKLCIIKYGNRNVCPSKTWMYDPCMTLFLSMKETCFLSQSANYCLLHRLRKIYGQSVLHFLDIVISSKEACLVVAIDTWFTNPRQKLGNYFFEGTLYGVHWSQRCLETEL